MYTSQQLRAAMRLYAVTDEAWLDGRTLVECVSDAIRGGATFIQLRHKGPGATHESTVELGRELAKVCREAGIPFVIDDDVQAALQAGADGVHVGQSDAECAAARQTLGPHAIVGVSVQTVEQALRAQAAGADYLGVGAMIATSTKTDADIVSSQELRDICRAVDIPVVAIGGLNASTLSVLRDTGVDGIAVVSAIFAAEDIVAATQLLEGALQKEGL